MRSDARSQALGGLMVAAALGGLAQSLAGSAGALLADDLGGTAVSGLPQAILVVGQAGAALALSRLTLRHGRRRALATGTVTAVAGAGAVAVAALAGSLTLALCGNVFLGAGAAAVMLSRYAAADLAEPEHRGRAMGRVLAATTIGAVAGPNLLAPSSDLAGAFGVPGLTGPYVVAALTFAGAALALARGAEPAAAPAPRTAADGDAGGARWTRRAVTGLGVLSIANIVMIAVMTMAPVQLHDHGAGLAGIGLVISAHIAGMFAPSPLSGRLTDRAGPLPAAGVAAALLVAGCAAGATSMAASSAGGMTLAMVLLGVGWNVALLSGSALLTADVPPAQRPAREGWGETGMGVAASSGGILSGVVMAGGGYGTLALGGAVVSGLIVPVALAARRPGAPAAPAVTAEDTAAALSTVDPVGAPAGRPTGRDERAGDDPLERAS